MIPKRRLPTHPGNVLLDEFLEPMRITRARLAAHIGVLVQRVNEIVRGKRRVSPETAWLLAQALGTSPEFWIQLQAAHDLASHRPSRPIKRLRPAGKRLPPAR
jgi:addiction module HigA family antidote